MSALDVNIPTADGTCPAAMYVPDASGSRPAVIMYPDAGGLRASFRDMGARLATLGFVALVPDVYYRSPYEPFTMDTAFTDDGERKRLLLLMRGLTSEMVVSDASGLLDFLAARDQVRGDAVGTTGYCMGGRLSLLVAGHHGERIAAAASFHGGNLAVANDPASPHHLAARVRASVYVAGAINDASFTDDQRELLSASYAAAGVRCTIETYEALHGFAVPDNPTYDAAAAERHWAAMDAFFTSQLVD